MQKNSLQKIFIPAFYVAAVVLVVLYAWNEQSAIRRGGSGELYRNLMDYPAFIRRGFDPAEIASLRDASFQNNEAWVRFQSPMLRVVDSGLPDLPKRNFLSPRGRDAEEFTIAILVDLDESALSITGSPRVRPADDSSLSALLGIFLACIGENWEIFLNGTLVKSEMHLDETGTIKSRRTWRDVYFPLDSTLLELGTNVLAFRIAGDPSYNATGLFYAAPYYLDDYQVIEGRQRNFLFILLCGIFGFTGFFYLMLFLSVRKKQEIFYLYYSLFSFTLCAYSFTRNGIINYIIPDSDVSIRLEYVSLFMMVPMLGLFIEALGKQKSTIVSRIVFIIYIAFSIAQVFSCSQFGEDILKVWNATVLLYYTYIFFYDIIYHNYYFIRRRGIKISAPDSAMFSILTGSILVYFCGIYDILDVILFHKSYSLYLYSTFVFHIGMALTLSQRFRTMYNQLEQSNVILEKAVGERTLELEKQTAIAIQASRAKSEFLATMSHEIRTPLNAVIGLSEIELQNRPHDSSMENIAQIHNSGLTLLGIIGDVLDISKIEAGSFDLVAGEYTTASLLSDTISLNVVRIGSKHINFILEINSDFPGRLFGDELRVRQVLNNLLSNAIKYTPEGTVTLKAEWENRGKEALLRFSVHDTGIGIRGEDMDKLFKTYAQLDTVANRKIEGTGLGLAITKNIVEMMGGKIAAESECGKGSVFTAEIIQGIPEYTAIGDETADNLRQFRYAVFEKGSNTDRPQMPDGRVLVVDDVQANIRVVQGLLAAYALKVDAAVSGPDAIGMIKSGAYDLVLMDHMMPGMDGVEAVSIIRAWEKENEKEAVPIVALTANALRGMKEFYLENGFDDYLSKPLNSQLLCDIIARWIPRHKQMPTAVNANIINTMNIAGSVIAADLESQRLDMLNHYRISFASGRAIDDTEYFSRFAALIETYAAAELPGEIHAQAILLAEAGKNCDAQKIRGILPSFYGALMEKHKAANNATETGDEALAEIVPRLQNAILAGDIALAEAVLVELASANLGDSGKELYYQVYDSLLTGETEKAAGAVSNWEEARKRGGQ